MRATVRQAVLLWIAVPFSFIAGCQSPTDPDDSVDVDDFLESSVSPSPANADQSLDGRTYRVVRGNNQPDDILAYDWKTSFDVTVRLNDKADDNDTVKFPVDLTAATITVKQASGGIVTTPTGGDVEHSDYIVSNTTSNRFGAINSSITLTFDVWYDLPSLRREALITVQLTFKDADGLSFSKSIDVNVAP
jgi:hypothetical protein